MRTISGGETSDLDDPTGMMITFAAKNFSLALPMPDVPKTEQTQRWQMPVWLGLGGKSFLGNAASISGKKAPIPCQWNIRKRLTK